MRYECPTPHVAEAARAAVAAWNQAMLGMVVLDEKADPGREGVDCDVVIKEGKAGEWPFNLMQTTAGPRDYSPNPGLALLHADDGWIDDPEDVLLHVEVWLNMTTSPLQNRREAEVIVAHELGHGPFLLGDIPTGVPELSVMDYRDVYGDELPKVGMPTPWDLWNVGQMMGLATFYKPCKDVFTGSPVEIVWGYDSRNQQYRKWAPGGPSFTNEFEHLVPFQGYFVLTSSPSEIQAGKDRLALGKGWNLVGWPLE